MLRFLYLKINFYIVNNTNLISFVGAEVVFVMGKKDCGCECGRADSRFWILSSSCSCLRVYHDLRFVEMYNISA